MSFVTIMASAAAAMATPHVVDIQHHGSAYEVHYISHVETSSKVIGISPPARTSTQRCIRKATVSVERRIHPANGGKAVSSLLPAKETFEESTPGACHNNDAQIAALTERKAHKITAHVAQLAAQDRPALLAEIDAARALAMN